MAESSRQTWRILALTAVLLLAWSVAVHWLPRPELAETNYMANRLRIERWMLGPAASNVIVGTSIAGRLLPTYFEGTRLTNLVNLGLDGANPDTGLALVLQRPEPPARVFLEVHRLVMPTGDNDRQLLDLVQGPGMELSRAFPPTRAEWRPSTVLYGLLKGTRGGSAAAPAVASESADPGAGMDPGWKERIVTRIRALESRGTRVVLVRMPVGRENPGTDQAEQWLQGIVRDLDLPLVDLYQRSRTGGQPITYTDGLHLDPASAARVSRWLAEESP